MNPFHEKINLFELEQKILKDISETFPYPFSECNTVYQKCCSFDKTIQILDICHKHDVTPDIIIDMFENGLIK